MEIELEQVRQLVALVGEANIRELTVRAGKGRITLKKATPAAGVTAPSAPAEEAAQVEVAPPAPPVLPPTLVPVTAPVVGVVRLPTGADGATSLRVGVPVQAGEVVCVVESMRIPNEVQAPVAGRVVCVFVEDGDPVEYGETLVELDPALAPIEAPPPEEET